MGSTEDDNTVSWRMYAAIAFAFVLLVLGIPLWWYTTEVYRVSLPENRIETLEEASIVFSFNVSIVSNNKELGELYVDEFKKYFDKAELFNIHITNVNPNSKWIPKYKEEADSTASKINVEVNNFYFVEWPEAPSEILITSHRVIYFTSETSGSKLIKTLSKTILLEDTLSFIVSQMRARDVIQQNPIIRRRMPISDHTDVVVTVVNPDPSYLTIDWDLRKTINEYLLPFVQSVSHISNITLKSHWLYFTSLSNKARKINTRWALPQAELPHLVTMFESESPSHLSNNPSLNLVVYLPSCLHSPLLIHDKQGNVYEGPNAFLSPRWGGIVIDNPSEELCKNGSDRIIFKPNIHYIMSTFLDHFRQLIGISEIDLLPGATILPLTTIEPRAWEIDSLMRLRAVEQLMSSRITLKSLIQLLTEIKNIVINDEVGRSIHEAVDKAEESAEYLESGKLELGFVKSRESYLSSEAAFSDPSLLALLYFPDDQKYAVYIPLFLPVMIPVIMSLNTIRLWLKPKIKEIKVD